MQMKKAAEEGLQGGFFMMVNHTSGLSRWRNHTDQA
jgi:hypothetical protein